MKRQVRNVRTTRLKPAHHNVGIHRVRAPGVGLTNEVASGVISWTDGREEPLYNRKDGERVEGPSGRRDHVKPAGPRVSYRF